MNTGAALDDGTPIGNGHPALKDKRVRVASPTRSTRKTLVDDGARRPRRRRRRRSSRRCTRTCTTTRARRRTRSTSPRPTRMLDAAGYKKGADGIRTMPDGGQPLNFRLFGRSSSQTSKQTVRVRRGLAQGHRHRGDRRRSSPRTRSPRSSARASSTCSSGAGSSSPTRTTSCRRSPARAGPTRTAAAIFANLSDSFYCNKAYDALYEQAGRARSTPTSAPRPSSRCRRCSTTTRRTS